MILLLELDFSLFEHPVSTQINFAVTEMHKLISRLPHPSDWLNVYGTFDGARVELRDWQHQHQRKR